MTLLVGGTRIGRFLSYRVEADLYKPEQAFSLDLMDPETAVTPGMQCELYVNSELALTGIIDKVTPGVDKSKRRFQAEGRDLMGLLVDSYAESFPTVKGKKLSDLAAMLLAGVPFIQREAIVYQQDLVSGGGDAGGPGAAGGSSCVGNQDAPQHYAQIEPGATIFETLKKYAVSRGMMFFGLPDGTFVFGRPKATGAPAYSLVCKCGDGAGNNVLDGELVDDISQRYSKVTVMGSRQGREDDGSDPTKVNTAASVTDEDFPFYKPFVAVDNNDEQGPAMRARAIMEQQKFKGFQLKYRVPGHTQNGRAWTVNELAKVVDEVTGVDGVYLVYGRTLEMSRAGVFTELKLSYPGIVA